MDTSQALTQYLYCGELFDHKLGWTYLRARYYDPKVGRFNRLDPFFGNTSDPQSLHKYAYCHGDPVNNVDPTGMFLLMGGFTVGMNIGSSLRSLNAGAAMQVMKTASINILKGMAKKAATDATIAYLFGRHLDDIKRELVLLSMSLAGTPSILAQTTNHFIKIIQEISGYLSLGGSFIPTPLNVITSVWKALPGEYGEYGANVAKYVKFARYSKYIATAVVAGIAVPLFIKFSGDILSQLGYPVKISIRSRSFCVMKSDF